MPTFVQEEFEKVAVKVRIALKRWFEYRQSDDETFRNNQQWQIYGEILRLKAHLEDMSSYMIDHQIALETWEKEKKKIDDEHLRSVSTWEKECNTKRREYERHQDTYRKRELEIQAYPALLAKEQEKFDDEEELRKISHEKSLRDYEERISQWGNLEKENRGSKPKKLSPFNARNFKPPKKPKQIAKPKPYVERPKPIKSAYPERPNYQAKPFFLPPRQIPKIRQMRLDEKLINSMWSRDAKKDVPLREGWDPVKLPQDQYLVNQAIKPWCSEQETGDWLSNLWNNLKMVADFEYNSGFELLANRLYNNENRDRLVSLNVQHRMHPKIAHFNSKAVYGYDYHSSSNTAKRGVPIRLFNSPLKSEDSLVMLDTSLFGEEAMEELDGGQRGRYVNVAEAKVIVETIEHIARDLSNTPHPEGRIWEIGIISFYRSQAAIIQKALQVSDVVRSKSRTRFIDAKSQSVQIEVNVVDGFQGREADIVILPMTRANDRGKLGFMTVLNRINVATSRARHRLILVGNVRKLKEMGRKHDSKNQDGESENSATEKAAPSNFVTQLVEHVQREGRTLQISPKDLRTDWTGIPLLNKANKSKGGRRL